MILVWLLAILGICLLVFAVVAGVVSGRKSRSNFTYTPLDEESRRQNDMMKRQNDILERNRMEAWSKPDYFGDKK